jgi:hypothetical protein
MSKGITFAERYDENVAGSNGECESKGMGDNEAEGTNEQVGIVRTIGGCGLPMGSPPSGCTSLAPELAENRCVRDCGESNG